MKKIAEGELFAGRYLLVQQLGVGGFSEVWQAQDKEVDNLVVAIKIFAPGNGLDTKGLEIFSKEYGLVFNLNNPYLLRPSYYGKHDGSPFLVMPYCKSGSALNKIGEMSENELARFMLQSATALAYLHSREPSIIHQDIKPDNFLVDDDGNYLLADFGISSRIRRTLTKSLGDKVSSGTLAYMPPEKFSEDKKIIKEGDIFSLGVTMYEMLTGDLPFGEHGGMVMLTGARIPNLPAEFSQELNTIVRTCLAIDPSNRPTAQKLVEIAKQFLKTESWPKLSIAEIGITTGRKTEPLQPFKEEFLKKSFITEKTQVFDYKQSTDFKTIQKDNNHLQPIKKQRAVINNTVIMIIVIGIAISAIIMFFVYNGYFSDDKLGNNPMSSDCTTNYQINNTEQVKNDDKTIDKKSKPDKKEIITLIKNFYKSLEKGKESYLNYFAESGDKFFNKSNWVITDIGKEYDNYHKEFLNNSNIFSDTSFMVDFYDDCIKASFSVQMICYRHSKSKYEWAVSDVTIKFNPNQKITYISETILNYKFTEYKPEFKPFN